MNAKVLKNALADALFAWKEKTFPNHFTPQAMFIYSHEPRTERYKKKKRRLFGHDIDNMYTGCMARTMMGDPGRATGSQSSVTLKIAAPNYLYYSKRRKDGGVSADKVEELATVKASEFEEMQKAMLKSVEEQIDVIVKSSAPKVTVV
jgi:hypothetical protein